MILFNKNDQDSISILMRRDSVSMGDDCLAPHEYETLFKLSDTIYDLLCKVAEYVPPMHDYEWKVMCGAEVIGRLISGFEKNYQIKLECQNDKITTLPEREVYCRKCDDQPLSYFERVEALYDGEYFDITIFPEYGDIKTILEKGATKITTCDETFALKNGFSHRELQYYDKILLLEDFEGLRIVQIPNNLDVDVEYIEISKDEIINELNKRA